MVELTEQQAKAIEEEKDPLHVLNPRTQGVFVLIRQDVYKLVCGRKSGVWGDEDDEDLILRES